MNKLILGVLSLFVLVSCGTMDTTGRYNQNYYLNINALTVKTDLEKHGFKLVKTEDISRIYQDSSKNQYMNSYLFVRDGYSEDNYNIKLYAKNLDIDTKANLIEITKFS